MKIVYLVGSFIRSKMDFTYIFLPKIFSVLTDLAVHKLTSLFSIYFQHIVQFIAVNSNNKNLSK